MRIWTALIVTAFVLLLIPLASSGNVEGPDGRPELIVELDEVNDRNVGYLELFMDITYVSEERNIVAGYTWSSEESLEALPFVTGVEPSLVYHLLSDVSVRSVRARDDDGGGAYDTYSPETVWDMGYLGEDIIVAIVDSGADDEYQGRLDDLDDDEGTNDPKFIGGYNARTDQEENPDDDNGHGTLMAGIVMGTAADDDTWLGIAPMARLVDVKVADSNGETSTAILLAALDWLNTNREADWDNDGEENNGIDVVLLSVGAEDTPTDGSDQVSLAVNTLVENGVTVIAAMGNGNISTVPSPASADLAIAVGGANDRTTVDREDDRLWEENAGTGTNKGPRLNDNDDDDIDELKPDIVAPAFEITAADGGNDIGDFGLFQVYTNGTENGTGTSMAAAHVAGVAALMLEANPSLTPSADGHPIREILRETAEARGTPFDVNLSSKYNTSWGWGLVDAYGAVLRALDLEATTLNVEAAVDSHYMTELVGKVRLTTTEYSGAGMVSFNFTIPRGWRELDSFNMYVNDIKVRSALGSDTETGINITETPSEDGHWSIAGWANLTDTEDEHWVEVKLYKRAPWVGSVERERPYEIRMASTFNARYSTSVSGNVNVTTDWGTVSGYVEDAVNEEPLQGARVRLTYEDTSTMVNETYTDETGLYMLVNVTEDYYDMEFAKGGYIKDDTTHSRIRVDAGENTSGIDIELDREGDEGYVEGWITDGSDPIEDVEVAVMDGTSEVNSSMTDADGYYLIEVDAGTYDIQASLNGYGDETAEDVDIDVGSFVTRNFTMEEQAPQARVHGTVLDDNSDPVDGAEVRAYNEDEDLIGADDTSSNGKYSIDLDPGTYRFRCIHPDFETEEVTDVVLDEGEEEQIDYDLVPKSDLGWLYGEITQSGTGDPIHGATVRATSGKKGNSALTNSTGGYTFYLEEGIYDVVVSKTGYVTNSDYEGVSISEGQGRERNIELVADNSAPVVMEVSFSPDMVRADGVSLFVITVTVDDDDGLGDIDEVTIDLSPIGGPASQRLSDSGTFGDETADDGTYTYESTTVKGTPDADYTITATVTDEAGASDTGTGILTIEKPPSDSGNESPGFEVVVFAFAAAVALVVVSRKRFK